MVSDPLKTLMLFVDGLGLGAARDSTNPIYSGVCPTLARLLDEHARPINALMDVAGIPQSATGQSTLLTGINAAERMGRHVEGLPGPELKALIREHNVLGALRKRGYAVTFANAYFTDDVEKVKARRHQSVTTVAALAGIGTVRDTRMLIRNEAVYQDLTRQALIERGYAGPMVTPREAGEHLLRIAEQHHFTLFEYFQTDRAGHFGARDKIEMVLRQFDEFLSVAVTFAERAGHIFLLTSDHGNIEDTSTTIHTSNPVPLVALGDGAEQHFRRVTRLDQVAPALLALYPTR